MIEPLRLPLEEKRPSCSGLQDEGEGEGSLIWYSIFLIWHSPFLIWHITFLPRFESRCDLVALLPPP